MRSATKKAGDVCPPWETLVSYFQSALPESDAAVIDDHFSSCDLCIDVARAAHERALALEHWSARSHGAAWKRQLVARAVDEISHQRTGEQLAERLKIWQPQSSAGYRRCGGSFGGFVWREICHRGPIGCCSPWGYWRFEPVGAVRDGLGEPLARRAS